MAFLFALAVSTIAWIGGGSVTTISPLRVASVNSVPKKVSRKTAGISEMLVFK